ncbi:O-antigen ligase family protein [Luteimonas sp. BDR2-5]|nr:O-antigen ligase family protein [Luteimonas sp. BDR2-5]
MLWSKSRTETAVQTFFLLLVWLAVLHLRSVPTRLAISTLIRTAVLISIASFIVAAIFPTIGFQPHSTTGLPELRGFFGHQQRLGLFCGLALGLLILVWANGELREYLNWGRKKAVLAMIIVLLAFIAAQARLFAAAFVISLLLTIGLSKPGVLRNMTISSIVLGVLVISLYSNQVMGLIDAIGMEGNSLSGRTVVWERSVEVANAAPLLGHGYSSFFSNHFDYIWGNYRAPHAHSSIVQAYFETGIVGLGLTICLVFTQMRESLKVGSVNRKYSYSLFAIILTITSSLTGVTYAGKPTVLFSMMMLILAMERQESRRRKVVARSTVIVSS